MSSCEDRVAIVIMSGGKDSHIGGRVPKGALDVGLLSHKSIFQLYFERIRRLQHLVQRKFPQKKVNIPVYIMCNGDNKETIEDFFRENFRDGKFFGIREQDVLFFTQGDYPICDKRWKYLLEEKHRIALSPNGNGGIFKALVEEGMVSDMKSRGVTSIYVPGLQEVHYFGLACYIYIYRYRYTDTYIYRPCGTGRPGRLKAETRVWV